MTTRFVEYRDKIEQMHRELGIGEDYSTRCGLPLESECEFLQSAEPDVFGRPVLLEGATLRAWRAMRAQAGRHGISLVLVSGFRSADYQYGIIRRKLDRGQCIEEILRVNAAPGYSEHHSGRAIDIGTPGVDHLSEAFEQSPAFEWLKRHAVGFGFHLSFPRDNPYDILYEPWHWKYSPDGSHET